VEKESAPPWDSDPVRAVEDELTTLLRRARAISWEATRSVHPGLDAGAYGLLLLLRRGGPLRLTDLATRIGVSKGTLSRQVNALENLGLVTRQPDPRDRRAAFLELTSAGHRRFDEVRAARQGQLSGILAGWSRTDQREFARLLRKFNSAPE
jgi:DNA-binding MarR family transcriptional regulator